MGPAAQLAPIDQLRSLVSRAVTRHFDELGNDGVRGKYLDGVFNGESFEAFCYPDGSWGISRDRLFFYSGPQGMESNAPRSSWHSMIAGLILSFARYIEFLEASRQNGDRPRTLKTPTCARLVRFPPHRR